MERESQKELEMAELDLRRLRKDQQLPPLMQLKLSFLQALLQQAPQKNDIGEQLEQFQRQSIEDLPLPTKKQLFIDTVRCLSGRDTVNYLKNQRAYLRRQGKFFAWQKCYLDCNSNALTLLRRRDCPQYFFRFDLHRLCLSKLYKKYKGKQVLALDCEGVKYVLGFDEEITCMRVHGLLRELINQKREWQVTTFDNAKFLQQRQADRLALPEHKVRQIMHQEEHQRLCTLQNKVKDIDMMSEEGFTLHRNLQQGRVLIGKDGSVKTQVILKGTTPIRAASVYIQMARWNTAVQSFEVTVRPRTNCLVAIIKTHKYSMLSYPRGATVAMNYFKSCQCDKPEATPRYYLLIESLQSQAIAGTVSMEIRQVVQFIPSKQDPNLLLVAVLTKTNFKGYCSDSDNLAMTLHLTEQIESFSSLVVTSKPQQYLGYFQQLTCPASSDMLEFNTDVSLPTERQDNESQSQRYSLKTIQSVEVINQKKIVAAVQDGCRGLVNQYIIQILKKRLYQSYYLRHRFSDKDESISYNEGDNRNFFMLGTKWQFRGDEVRFIDAEALAAQKDILKMILKQISSNIMQGKSVMNMSLPVQIFDKRSMLGAIADSYGFLPAFLPKILSATDPVEKMKHIVGAMMFVSATNPTVEKPFNPILGQTYQGKLGSLSVCLEQISHHPPISSLLIQNEEVCFWGNVEINLEMGLNSMYSYLCHWLNIKILTTGEQYLVKLPDIEMGGLMYGARYYQVINRGFILQKTNNLFCEFSIGKDKKRVYEVKPKIQPADLAGGIFRVKQEFADKVLLCPKPKSFEGLKPEHVVQTCCLITGKWYGDLFFDKVCYKSFKEGPYPLKCERMRYLLPSDSLWREDIIYRVWRDMERSNREKQRMQNLQRNDRKLREKFSKGK